jgi:hypothetical protein
LRRVWRVRRIPLFFDVLTMWCAVTQVYDPEQDALQRAEEIYLRLMQEMRSDLERTMLGRTTAFPHESHDEWRHAAASSGSSSETRDDP